MSDPFQDISTEDPFEGISMDEGESSFKAKPFGPTQRMILQNFFDTNDSARRQYMKELGYELNSLDDNQFRPIGSEMDWLEVDPGFSDAYKKGGLKGLAQEFLQDTGDIAYDMADIGAKVMAGLGTGLQGAAGGGAAGSVVPGVGTAVGAFAGGIPAAMVGAAASGALTNSAKQKIRDVFLDKDIPYDAKEMAVDAALSAVGSGLFKGAVKGFQKLKDVDLSTSIDGIKNAIKAAGGLPNPELVERAAKNPELFSKEAVEGGASRLQQGVKNIFGLDEDEMLRDIKDLKRIRPDSYFGKLISPVAETAEKAKDALSLDRGANVSYADAMGQLQGLYGALENKILTGAPTQMEENAFKVLKDKMRVLRNMGAGNLKLDPKKVTDAQLSQVSFNHGQARDFLNSLQDAAFDVTTKNENPVLRQIAGGMRSYLDDVAVKSGNPVGQQLPELNKVMSGLLDDYKTARQTLNPQTIVQAYVGGQSTPGGTIKANEIQQFMGGLDEKYGTDLAKDFDVSTAQALFENVYKGAPSKGSSRVNAFLAQETGKGVLKGASTGALVGGVSGLGAIPSAVVGGVLGGARAAKNAAALAQPEVGLSKLQQLLAKQTERDAMDPVQLAIKDSLAGGLGAGALSQANQVEGNAPPEVDPFADISMD
jgi:hypothetical protein